MKDPVNIAIGSPVKEVGKKGPEPVKSKPIAVPNWPSKPVERPIPVKIPAKKTEKVPA
jgi:hypothetical protein